jgi:hypothetical protein
MSLSTSTFRRLGAILTLTAAIASVAAPTTLANHQDVGVKQALKQIRGSAGAPDAVDRYLRNHPHAPTGVECDAICRYLHNHESGVTLTTDTLGGTSGAPLQPAATSNGFNWSAAALGGATASGALILVVAGTLLMLRRRRSLAA